MGLVCTDIQQDEWDSFVDRSPEASGYHLWGWRTVFQNAFGHDCQYLALRDRGTLVGVLPIVILRSWLFGRFGVSLPFVNYGGLLAARPADADALVAGAAESAFARGLTHLEFRHRRQQCPSLPVKQHKVAMYLTLASSADDMWAALDRKVRNQIRKAEKNGLEVIDGGSELLVDFYGVFARNMRDLGTPVYSPRFFDTVLRQFPARTRVFVIRKDGKPIAAAVSYAFRDAVEVPWASALKDYLPLCPNNLLYWSVIRYAIARGFRILDFGRSTPNVGTFHFKRQWGAEPSPLYWEYRLLSRTTVPDQGPGNPKLRAAIEAWKRLPLGVANLLGPPIVRGIP